MAIDCERRLLTRKGSLMAKKQRFDYFEAFVLQARIARKESQALVAAMEDYRPDDPGWFEERLEEMHAIEKEGDTVSHEIFDHLAVEFIPPIDREDVTELCILLDDVTDQVEEVMQHLYMYDLHSLHPLAVKTAHVIDEAVEAVAEATRAFNEFKKPKKLNKLLVAVHDKESEADELYMEGKRDVFLNHADESPAYLIAWNNMFSHMERCCDSCEGVASVMQKIALKNS